ncbi:MAG: hypothetical protein GC152_03600 [Alphaproteobacteria bacterium]|nr:hypothetical protein [Alphaproteobacteria bacterium]
MMRRQEGPISSGALADRGSAVFALLFAVHAGAASARAGGLPDIDRSDLPNGEARFVLIQNDEEKGEMRYSFACDAARCILHDGTTLYPNIRESGSATLDAATFAPLTVSLDGDFARNILDAELAWADGRVTGEYRRKGPNDVSKTVVPFDREAPAGAILRWSVFALVQAMPLNAGDVYELNWFAPLSGAYAPAILRVEGRELVETPAGETMATRVVVDASPRNVILVADAPRRIVRIDVPDQNMRFERLPDPPATPE